MGRGIEMSRWMDLVIYEGLFYHFGSSEVLFWKIQITTEGHHPPR
jgi:hypothetical protein